ncbi:MAG: hypothetical protein AAFV95_18980 [Bacteroidota bacterium]
MKFQSITNPKFIKAGNRIVEENGEILVLLRYPGGNRNFILFPSKEKFNNFLKQRKKKESITIFKSTEIIQRGLVNETFLSNIFEKAYGLSKIKWLSIGKQSSEEDYDNWCFIADILELTEEIEDSKGSYITVIKEPDWFDENRIYHGYAPDEDGIIRPTSY